jgi:hypothetical protein
MRPETARALLALSREQTARLRARRDLRAALKAMGWRDSEHAELIECHERAEAAK